MRPKNKMAFNKCMHKQTGTATQWIKINNCKKKWAIMPRHGETLNAYC